MVWWFVSLAARAGTPPPLWTLPVSGTVIPYSVTAGDFDADGVTDFSAVVAVSAKDYRLVYGVSGVYTEVLPFEDPLPFRLEVLSLDASGKDTLVLYDPEGEESGALFLAEIPETKPGAPKPVFTLLLEGTKGSLLAADFDVADQDILVGAPGLDAVYRVPGDLTGDFQLDELELDLWQGPPQGVPTGFGAGVVVRERAGAEEAVIARCAVEAGACTNAGLAVRPVSELKGPVALSAADLLPAPDAPLLSLETIEDLDGDSVEEVVWVGATQKTVLSSGSTAAALLSIDADGDDVVANSGLSGGQLWVRDGDTVYVIDRFDADGSAAEIASDAFALGAGALGLALADVGDQNGDGCDDIIATAEATDTVYLLPSPCTEPDAALDTGADSGVAPDTNADTSARCEPGLGWACGGSTSAVAWLGLVGLLWRQRTQTAKLYRYE